MTLLNDYCYDLVAMVMVFRLWPSHTMLLSTITHYCIRGFPLRDIPRGPEVEKFIGPPPLTLISEVSPPTPVVGSIN